MLNLRVLESLIDAVTPEKLIGTIISVKGNRLESIGPMVEVGSPVSIKFPGATVLAQVVGFENGKFVLMPFEDNLRVSVGTRVEATSKSDRVGISEDCLGRVFNCFNNTVDGRGPVVPRVFVDLMKASPNPLSRKPISTIFETKVKAIDLMLTAGRGQRLGVFSGAGVGKSTLLGMIARNSSADINVITLIGERGREVKDFLERDLKEGLTKSVVIISTAEESALKKIRAALLALAYAEYFRDQGKNVLFLCDSLTRLAQALRELGGLLGELPVARGYPPSCFQFLAKYLERFGNSDSCGSLTSFFTVLVDGDDLDEPVSDAVRAILDGHIVLSRELASQGIYPAVDFLNSISRVSLDIQTKPMQNFALCVRNIFATYEQNKDLVLVGAYKPGSDFMLDLSLNLHGPLTNFFQQKPDEAYSIQDALQEGIKILASAKK
ncbi:MAG: FliI/YscN family ATPase [Deltaproteobacteria bacterium]|nr:FliI/YscN family ATPase [Deltaproteobacteria bacterium]